MEERRWELSRVVEFCFISLVCGEAVFVVAMVLGVIAGRRKWEERDKDTLMLVGGIGMAVCFLAVFTTLVTLAIAGAQPAWASLPKLCE